MGLLGVGVTSESVKKEVTKRAHPQAKDPIKTGTPLHESVQHEHYPC